MAVIDFKRLRILLVDDEWFIRSTIRQMLRQIGVVNTYEAEGAAAGIAETLRVKPHLVLCDVHMPDGDGLSYLGELRKAVIPSVAETPVVMLTSDGTPDVVLGAKDLKVSGYLLKPVSPAALKKAIERALSAAP
ncbi:response regulator [Azospirillum sp. TSO22-1]|uniref:response regulator n=1 Tax=Azospirillum sp. TSO22-1 TaxID=716789 RepID=UPI000D6048BA|nr:response regulator [Azospirillum sp. TSO22-1]PWC52572.1 chemotaxis protein CheY [Azospirillum sp. TSO22-1]